MSKASPFNVDASGLERAANALKIIESSPHGALTLQSLIKEHEFKRAEYAYLAKQKEVEKVKVEGEERRKNLDHELDLQKKRAEYSDKLQRKQKEDFLLRQEEWEERNRQKREAAIKREEEIKRETFDIQHKKAVELEAKKAEFKARAKAELERKNHDLRQKDLKLREEERRKTLLEIFTLNLNAGKNAFQYLIENKRLILTFSLYFGAIYSSYYLSKNAIGLMTRILEAKFAKPALVRETSRLGFKNFYKYPFKFFKYRFRNVTLEKKLFKDIVLKNQLEDQLKVLSNAIFNRRKNLAPLRNIIFYGPPGTGKTLFAKNLAYFSGMEYCIFTGADVAPLGDQAVTEIHKIFDWANQTRNGMIIFIDEADAFFRKRDYSSENPNSFHQNPEIISENLRNSINAFLYRSGTPSKKVMFVAATNAPSQLDKALHDRVDQMILFDLPEKKERIDLIYLYFSKYCDPKKRILDLCKDFYNQPETIFYKKKIIRIHEVNETMIDNLATKLEGFSAREIEKFIILCHDIAFGKSNPIIDKNLIDEALDQALFQHNQRKLWC